MVHGDNKGLVMPPKVAPIQVVVVPIVSAKFSVETSKSILNLCAKIENILKTSGLRCKADLRTDKKPGWKYNYWEQKGVCIRIEVGEKEVEKENLCFVRRDTGERQFVEGLLNESKTENLVEALNNQLEVIHKSMLDKARKVRDERISVVWNFEDFIKALGKGNLVLAPWSLTTETEEWVKEETQKIFSAKTEVTEEEKERGEIKQLTGAAKTLCIPFNQPPLPKGTKCFTGCGAEAMQWCLWGRSY